MRLLWVWCDGAKERAPAPQMHAAVTVRFIYGLKDGRTTSVAPSRGLACDGRNRFPARGVTRGGTSDVQNRQ